VDGSIAPLIIGFALFNLGAGPLVTLGTGIVIRSVPPQKAGAAAAVSQTSNEFGFALGIAIIGSIGAIVYRLKTAVLPSGLSSASAHSVQSNLANAVATSQQLPQPLSGSVLHAARAAYVQEYHTVALISATALLVVILVITTKLKSLSVSSDS
jgi:MFS transporter, DHA2 family, multidrug resistance protein